MAKLTCNFLSYTLHRAVDITVIVPSICFPEMMAPNPSHAKAEKYPVLYLLHGYGNNHATWNGYTSVELYAEERNIAVVMLSAENKSYINHGGDDNYFDFISHELPEFVQSMFPVSSRPQDTYIAGLSMGGSEYPIDELKVAGVDLTKPDTVLSAMKVFEDSIDELAQIIDEVTE